jgi:hypothetical protein
MTWAQLDRRIPLPSTADLGWGTESLIPYVLGDFRGTAWASHPIYYGSGSPKMGEVDARAGGGAADWRVEFDRGADNWKVYRAGSLQTNRAEWNRLYVSDGGEVAFEVVRGSDRPKHQDFFAFSTYEGGRLPAYQFHDSPKRYALGVGYCEPESVWDGSSKLTLGTHYEVKRSELVGVYTTWVEILSGAITGPVTWTGQGARSEITATQPVYLHELARDLIWRWGRLDNQTDPWELIDRASFNELGRDCYANRLRARYVVSVRESAREALEKLLWGVATWQADGYGRIRLVPLRYQELVTVLVDIPEEDLEVRPKWATPGRGELQNTIRLEYDAFAGIGTPPGWLERQDDRSLRAHGDRPVTVDDIYRAAAVALYDHDAAHLIAGRVLRLTAQARERVELSLPLERYAHLQLGDELTYTSDEVPDRPNRDERVERRQARVVGLAYDLTAMRLTATVEHLPSQLIELGES